MRPSSRPRTSSSGSEEVARAGGGDASVARARRPRVAHSARNFVHYVALRQHDLRDLQVELSQRGLSSLGRSEGASSNSLLEVSARAHEALALRGDESARKELARIEKQRRGALSSEAAKFYLHQHTRELLGPRPGDRHIYIMVTAPSAADADRPWMAKMLRAGMNVLRINCAHETEREWGQMIGALREARRETRLECRVLMDLAGPRSDGADFQRASHRDVEARERRHREGHGPRARGHRAHHGAIERRPRPPSGPRGGGARRVMRRRRAALPRRAREEARPHRPRGRPRRSARAREGARLRVRARPGARLAGGRASRRRDAAGRGRRGGGHRRPGGRHAAPRRTRGQRQTSASRSRRSRHEARRNRVHASCRARPPGGRTPRAVRRRPHRRCRAAHDPAPRRLRAPRAPNPAGHHQAPRREGDQPAGHPHDGAEPDRGRPLRAPVHSEARGRRQPVVRPQAGGRPPAPRGARQAREARHRRRPQDRDARRLREPAAPPARRAATPPARRR